MHGGKSLSGAANPAFRTGKYSSIIPVKLAERYEKARTSPTLLSLKDDLAVCEARLVELFQRVDSGESGALYAALGKAFEAFNAAMADKDITGMQQHLGTMRRLITQGSEDYTSWAEIQKLWETRCRLTLVEQKTLIAERHMITVDQLMVCLGIIVDAIKTSVTRHAEAPIARTILSELSATFRTITTIEA